MKNERLLEAVAKAKGLLEEIDNIGISTEVIESLNVLTCDKLEELQGLRRSGGGQEELIGRVLDASRNANSYITMNYLITDNVIKINENTAKIHKTLKEITNLIEEDINKKESV